MCGVGRGGEDETEAFLDEVFEFAATQRRDGFGLAVEGVG